MQYVLDEAEMAGLVPRSLYDDACRRDAEKTRQLQRLLGVVDGLPEPHRSAVMAGLRRGVDPTPPRTPSTSTDRPEPP